MKADADLLIERELRGIGDGGPEDGRERTVVDRCVRKRLGFSVGLRGPLLRSRGTLLLRRLSGLSCFLTFPSQHGAAGEGEREKERGKGAAGYERGVHLREPIEGKEAVWIRDRTETGSPGSR